MYNHCNSEYNDNVRSAFPVCPGGGHLVYLIDGICTPSQVSFLPLFSNIGYQKKATFQKLVAKSVISLLSYEFFYILEHSFRLLCIKLAEEF